MSSCNRTTGPDGPTAYTPEPHPIATCEDVVQVLDRLRREEDATNARLKAIVSEREMTLRALTEEMVRAFPVLCVGCGTKSEMHRWTFMQRMIYVPIHRGECGYWENTKLEACSLSCPGCNHRNRLSAHPAREAIVNFLNPYFLHRLASIFDAPIVERRIK